MEDQTEKAIYKIANEKTKYLAPKDYVNTAIRFRIELEGKQYIVIRQVFTNYSDLYEWDDYLKIYEI